MHSLLLALAAAAAAAEAEANDGSSFDKDSGAGIRHGFYCIFYVRHIKDDYTQRNKKTRYNKTSRGARK